MDTTKSNQTFWMNHLKKIVFWKVYIIRKTILFTWPICHGHQLSLDSGQSQLHKTNFKDLYSRCQSELKRLIYQTNGVIFLHGFFSTEIDIPPLNPLCSKRHHRPCLHMGHGAKFQRQCHCLKTHLLVGIDDPTYPESSWKVNSFQK